MHKSLPDVEERRGIAAEGMAHKGVELGKPSRSQGRWDGSKGKSQVGVGDVLAKEVLCGRGTWPTWQGEWVGVLLKCRAWDLGSVFGRTEPSGVSEQQWRMGL